MTIGKIKSGLGLGERGFRFRVNLAARTCPGQQTAENPNATLPSSSARCWAAVFPRRPCLLDLRAQVHVWSAKTWSVQNPTSTTACYDRTLPFVSGVPGPLSFFVYIDGASNIAVHIKIAMYADDIQLSKTTVTTHIFSRPF